MDAMPLTDNPFAVLSFLAAPAILTNASTLLALSTSNRLARASDRARAAYAAVLASPQVDPASSGADVNRRDFQIAGRRALMLVQALRRLYFATGSFAAGTCVALLGAFAGYFNLPGVPLLAQVLTIAAAILGVGALVAGSAKLLGETRLALRSLDELHASLTQWRAARSEPGGSEPSPDAPRPAGPP